MTQPTPPDSDRESDVTDLDREAAAHFYRGSPASDIFALNIMIGNVDDDVLVQLFAAHRRAELTTLRQRADKLEAALRFYADKANWTNPSYPIEWTGDETALKDAGERAKASLGELT